MALVKCTECSNEISNKAESCPKCGHPVTKKSSTPKASLNWSHKFLALVILVCFVQIAFKCSGNDIENQKAAQANQKVNQFNANSAAILSGIQKSIQKKDYSAAKTQADEFFNAGIRVPELTDLRNKAIKGENLLLIKKSREPNELVSAYGELLQIEPNNDAFKKGLEKARKEIEKAKAAAALRLAHFGEPPVPSAWDGSYRVVEDYLKAIAKDPDSVKIHSCTRVSFNERAGWLVGCDWGARNGFGGMTRTGNWFVVRHNAVVRMEPLSAFK